METKLTWLCVTEVTTALKESKIYHKKQWTHITTEEQSEKIKEIVKLNQARAKHNKRKSLRTKHFTDSCSCKQTGDSSLSSVI